MSIYYVVSDDTLKDIADSIRDKRGYSADRQIAVEDYADEITNIDTSDQITGLIQGENGSFNLNNSAITEVPYLGFYYKYKLGTVNLPNATTIAESAFSACPYLTSLNLPSALTVGAYACSSSNSDISKNIRLTTVNLPNATSIGQSAFYSCTALTEIDVSSATSIGISAFYGCTALTEIDVSSATSIGESAFYNCRNLISVTGKLTTSTSTSYNGAFQGCTSLRTVLMPQNTGYQYRAFYGCTALEEVDLGSPTTIYNQQFYNCSSLRKLTIRTTTGVPTINGTPFTNVTMANVTVYVPSDLVSAYQANSTFSACTIVALDDTFEIDGTSYDDTARETWASWIASANNTISAQSDGKLVWNSTKTAYVSDGLYAIAPSDVIDSDTAYVWVAV